MVSVFFKARAEVFWRLFSGMFQRTFSKGLPLWHLAVSPSLIISFEAGGLGRGVEDWGLSCSFVPCALHPHCEWLYLLPPCLSTYPLPLRCPQGHRKELGGRLGGREKKEQTLASDAQLLYYACLPLSHCFLERLKINTFVILTCNSHFPDKLLTLQPQPLRGV